MNPRALDVLWEFSVYDVAVVSAIYALVLFFHVALPAVVAEGYVMRDALVPRRYRYGRECRTPSGLSWRVLTPGWGPRPSG